MHASLVHRVAPQALGCVSSYRVMMMAVPTINSLPCYSRHARRAYRSPPRETDVRVVLTGGSSFTGYWFARALADAGHEVVAPLSGSRSSESYTGIRATRVAMLQACAQTRFDAPFGSETFLHALREAAPFDVLCHHRAERRGSAALTFDVDPVAALQANTQRLVEILHTMKEAGCGSMILTGSVFEEREGIGDVPLQPRNAFDLSKGLTSTVCDFYCRVEGIAFDRFVIATPFGPYEERGLANYLMQSWFAGKTAHVSGPRYVRDHIHIRRLASCYAQFVSETGTRGGRKIGPSGYIESLGDFARRVAQETRKRTKLLCPTSFGWHNDFDEPAIRINTTMFSTDTSTDDLALWDEYVHYYQLLRE